jgi:hypothetical protein
MAIIEGPGRASAIKWESVGSVISGAWISGMGCSSSANLDRVQGVAGAISEGES